MTYTTHTEEKSGFTLKIQQDEPHDCPYDDWDMLGTFYHWHRRGFVGKDLSRMDQEDIQAKADEITAAGGLVVPVYLYEHSGQTINTTGFSCRWDSGQVGFWAVTAEELKAEYGAADDDARTKARQCVIGEVKTIDDYLTGNVWGFVVENAEGEHIDSCWGFYGNYESEGGALSEGRAMLDHHIEQARKKRMERIKTMIRNHVPLDIRQTQLATL